MNKQVTDDALRRLAYFSPTHALLDAVLAIEVPKFFLKVDPERNQYLYNLFNSSFYWHLIQIDEECSNLLREVTKDQELYLDTNTLYPLLGFHGVRSIDSSRFMHPGHVDRLHERPC